MDGGGKCRLLLGNKKPVWNKATGIVAVYLYRQRAHINRQVPDIIRFSPPCRQAVCSLRKTL